MSTGFTRNFVISPVFRFWYDGQFWKVKISQVLPGYFIGYDIEGGTYRRFNWQDIQFDRDGKFPLVSTLLQALGLSGVADTSGTEFFPRLLKAIGLQLELDGFNLPPDSGPPPFRPTQSQVESPTSTPYVEPTGLDALLKTPPYNVSAGRIVE
jgi:hypothetical protein